MNSNSVPKKIVTYVCSDLLWDEFQEKGTCIQFKSMVLRNFSHTCMCIEFLLQVPNHKNTHAFFLLGWYSHRDTCWNCKGSKIHPSKLFIPMFLLSRGYTDKEGVYRDQGCVRRMSAPKLLLNWFWKGQVQYFYLTFYCNKKAFRLIPVIYPARRAKRKTLEADLNARQGRSHNKIQKFQKWIPGNVFQIRYNLGANRILTKWDTCWNCKASKIPSSNIDHSHLYLYLSISISIYICCRVNNLAVISQWPGQLYFIVFVVFFFKNPLLSAGRMIFLKKKVLTKKVWKKVGSITWPSFGANFRPKIWPGYWPYHDQVIDPTFLTKKTKNQHLKIIKKPYFYSVFDQQTKKTRKQPKKKQ